MNRFKKALVSVGLVAAATVGIAGGGQIVAAGTPVGDTAEAYAASGKHSRILSSGSKACYEYRNMSAYEEWVWGERDGWYLIKYNNTYSSGMRVDALAGTYWKAGCY